MDMSTEIGDGVIMDYFVSMLLIGIGVALIATGLFTSYFGAGKSQKIGFALLFFGVGIIAYFIVLYPLAEDIFVEALVSGVAALGGMENDQRFYRDQVFRYEECISVDNLDELNVQK